MALITMKSLRVVSFESRMAGEMAHLIERVGGKPCVIPALREITSRDPSAVSQFGSWLMAGNVDLLILLTGVGTVSLFNLLKILYPWPSIKTALGRVSLVARGPKPVAALKKFGLLPTFSVPEPYTWMEVISLLDQSRPVKGLRVAVQEYGSSNPDLLKALADRGATVFPVSIYKWALPEDLAPLRQVLHDIMNNQAEVLLITNVAQVDHVMRVLEQEGAVKPFRAALARMVVASIGPSTSEGLRRHGWPVDFEPTHPKLGILVKEIIERAPILLDRKR